MKGAPKRQGTEAGRREGGGGDAPYTGPSRLRAVVIVGCTLAVLVAAFVVYLAFQPRLTRETETAGPEPILPIPGQHAGPLNAGKGVWVKHYDKQGRLSSQLRAVKYDPVSEDTIHVTLPEARFFMSDGQVLRITGRDGVVVTRQEPDRHAVSGVPAQMPTRGRLEDVQIELFAPGQIERLDQDLPAHPTLTATMNNAVFDSDLFRIYTDDCTIDNKHVAGHMVPVVVTGDDYDFRGYGLLVRWNDRLRRLELLEIHQGDVLVIKHPSRNSGLGLGSEHEAVATSEVVRVKGAAGGNTQVIPASRPATKKPDGGRDTLTPVYRADFEQDVRIFQNDALLATAQTLQVDFKPKDQSKESAAPTAPPAVPPAVPSTAEAREVSHPSATAQTPIAPAARPSTHPAGQAASPMTIRWTGPLRITPVDSAKQQAIPQGQAIVRLLGAPVTLSSRGSLLRATSVTYRTAEADAMLKGNSQMPVTMTESHGATVTTESMLYQPRQQQAELLGAGHASGLVQSDNPQKQESLDASWSRRAVIHFRSEGGDSPQQQADISAALLEGDVRIRHPQVRLSGDRVDLSFDRAHASWQPAQHGEGRSGTQLQSLLASGNVHTVLLDKENGEQRLSAGRLQLTMAHTPQGRAYPQMVQADDAVQAELLKQQQQLRADHLRIALAPSIHTSSHAATRATTQPAIALQSLHADGHVHVQDAHSSAMGDDLLVTMTNNQPDVTLGGTPAKLLGQNGEQLTGPMIHYVPARHIASIDGPGQITAMQQSADGKSRPFHATWATGVRVDGEANTITLTGQVKASSKDAEGGELSAGGDTLTLLLASNPSARTKAPSADSQLPLADNFLQNKQVREAIFDGHASMQSLLTADEHLQRRLYLESPRIQYNFPKQELLVPQAGRMLVEDHEAGRSAATGPSARGNTAFSWSRSFSFDQSAHEAVLLGDVRIVHQPDAGNGQAIPFSLNAQRVTADFTPTHSATRASTAPSQPPLQLTRLTADDSVRIESQLREVNAGHISYDPVTSLLTAVGTGERHVQLRNADGSLRGEFESLLYNLEEDRIVQMKNAQFQSRP